MVNKADMARMLEAIEEYLRSYQGVVKDPLAYTIRKTILVQTYGDYPLYAFHDDAMIIRVAHVPPHKKKLLLEHSFSQRTFGKVQERQQSCLQYNGSDLQSYRSVSICQKAKVQERWQRHILHHQLQVAMPKSCECNSIRG